MHRKKPTQTFALASLSLFVFFWIVVSMPQLNQVIANSTHVNILYLIGSGSPIGPAKIKLFKIVAAVCLSINALVMISLWRLPDPLARTGIFLLLLPLYATALSWPELVRYDRFGKLKIESPPPGGYSEIFNRSYLNHENITSTDDFYALVNRRYLKFHKQMTKHWHIDSKETEKAIFYMNTVAALWRYESCIKSDDPNESGDSRIQRYLAQKDACCTDFAQTLKLLLDKASIKNRLVSLPGHIFNEAFVNGHWQVFDPTANIMFNQSWSDVSFLHNPDTRAIAFPHLNTRKEGNPYYSPNSASIRVEQLMWALEKNTLPITYEDTTDLWSNNPKKTAEQGPLAPLTPKAQKP